LSSLASEADFHGRDSASAFVSPGCIRQCSSRFCTVFYSTPCSPIRKGQRGKRGASKVLANNAATISGLVGDDLTKN
jgi:hypothetical protein